MADDLLVGVGNVWPRLAADLIGDGRPRAGRAYLAIAYIGATADNWIYLRTADVLICDASEEAVRLGLTNVDQLIRWNWMGIKIYSRPGLHAKTGVIGGTGFIGSANASQTSAEERNEAVLLTSNSEVVAGIRSYIESLRKSPSLELNDLSLEQLSKITPRPPRWPRGAVQLPAVPQAGRVWLLEWEPDPGRTMRERKQLKGISRQHQGAVGRADRILDMRLSSDEELRGWRNGDVIVFCNLTDPWAHPPAVVVDRERAGYGQRAAVFYRVRGDLRKVRRKAIEEAIMATDPSWRRRGSRTQITGQAREAVAALAWNIPR